MLTTFKEIKTTLKINSREKRSYKNSGTAHLKKNQIELEDSNPQIQI